MVVDSPDASAIGRRFELDGTTLTVGRNAKGPGAIADLRLSRQHLRLAGPGPERMEVEDLGTRNGSFLDGQPLTRPTPLLVGQVLSAGDTLWVVDEPPRLEELPSHPEASGVVPEVVGASALILALRRSIETLASVPGSVLILGPTGVGKEIVARALHRYSRRAGPFIALNCAAIPQEIAEAELFGARKGAYTGAVVDRPGAFVEAHGGTLFLDELGELSRPLQAKLLRVLEERQVQPVGGGPPVPVDVRVLAATNATLDQDQFRSDLFARLAQFVLRIPPLAARRADVLPLWDHFMRIEGQGGERPRTPELSEALLLHDWPMNGREVLRLVRLLLMVGMPGVPCGLDELPEALQAPLLRRDQEAPVQDQGPSEDVGPGKSALEELLRRAQGNITTVASELGVHRQQVYRWIRRLRLDVRQFR